LAKLSAFSNRGFIGNLIAMKAYIDSSGKSDFDRAKAVTLTVYFGTPEHFTNFEVDWMKTLEEQDAPIYTGGNGVASRYFHFNEVIHQKDGYSKKNGWDLKRSDALIAALFNVFGRADRSQSRMVSCTVNTSGYQEARRKKPNLPVRPEKICLDVCFSLLFAHSDDDGNRVSELFVDRGDWYTKQVHSFFNTKKSRQPWWAKRLASVGSVDSHFIYGVQAADYIAGIANRHYTKGHEDRWGAMLPGTILLGHFNVAYDGPELLVITDDDGKYLVGQNSISPTPVQLPVKVVSKDEIKD
jgi:hypothetical protein